MRTGYGALGVTSLSSVLDREAEVEEKPKAGLPRARDTLGTLQRYCTDAGKE